jgi:MFS family permease
MAGFQHAWHCAGAGAVTAWGAPNYEALVLGRVLYGLAIGFGMHAAPAYISETVPPCTKLTLIWMSTCSKMAAHPASPRCCG